MTWRDEAACAGMTWWTRDRRPEQSIEDYNLQRKRVCALCPVRQECREEARALPELASVWGGETADERLADWLPKDRPNRVPKNLEPKSCPSCGRLFTPAAGQKRDAACCSDECRAQRRAEQHAESARSRALESVSKARPCPMCGTTQKIAKGVCQGWECQLRRKNESRRRVAS